MLRSWLRFVHGSSPPSWSDQASGVDASEALDMVITNALIIDAVQGVIKADIGIKGGMIVGLGKAGNPDVMDGVTPGMVTGVTTEAMAGEKLIVTAGGLDTHVHWICPQIVEEAIASGLTTLFGGGTGPASGTCATTCTPAPAHVKMMLQANASHESSHLCIRCCERVDHTTGHLCKSDGRSGRPDHSLRT